MTSGMRYRNTTHCLGLSTSRIDGTFPQRLPQNIFLPEATLEDLGVRSLEKERLNAAHQFYSLILSADTVTLSWPENEGDRPVVPSPKPSSSVSVQRSQTSSSPS